MIRRNIETEARLVDDLLDLTRIARGKVQLHFEVVDAHAALRNVLSMFHREIEEKGLTVSVALRAKPERRSRVARISRLSSWSSISRMRLRLGTIHLDLQKRIRRTRIIRWCDEGGRSESAGPVTQ
jgi:signal transduction histidine kinase